MLALIWAPMFPSQDFSHAISKWDSNATNGNDHSYLWRGRKDDFYKAR